MMNGTLKAVTISVPIPKRKAAGILMCKRRLWTSIVIFILLFAFFYFCILPDTIELGSLVILPLKKDPEYVTTTTITPAEHGCLDVVYGNYCVLSILSEAERSATNLGSLTLCTQGTVEFLKHVSVLCERWGGPISVAVYSPSLDFADARSLVVSLRHCDFCIRHWVSWHFFGKQELGGGNTFAEFLPDGRTDGVPRDCSAIAGRNRTEKRKSEDAYPINVGRNLARHRSQTPYVFSLDIELYPSTGVLPKFERMVRSLKKETSGDPQVWVLPVFEVRSMYSAPRTKFQLKQMFERRQAISFHMFRCNVCHMIPNLPGWIEHESQLKSEVNDSFEELKVFATVKRTRKERLGDWEPFFIGSNKDPEFDIRLSWEGKLNKMQMAYEMCLRNYSFHIVDNAFLVHFPGINVYNATKERKRYKYIRENNKWYSLIKKDLKKIYGSNTDC